MENIFEFIYRCTQDKQQNKSRNQYFSQSDNSKFSRLQSTRWPRVMDAITASNKRCVDHLPLPVLRNLPAGQVGSGRCCGKSTVPADNRSVTQRTLKNSAHTNPSPKWCGGWGVGEATWPVARSAGRGAGGAPPGALQHQIRRGCLNGALPPAKRSEFRAAAPRLSTAAQSAQRTTGPEATPTPHPPHHSQHGTAPQPPQTSTANQPSNKASTPQTNLSPSKSTPTNQPSPSTIYRSNSTA